ncbi:MAG: class I tRNA ligase family protein, partial [Deltaproteobacteria bacterium]|nr:class I tRNA ligase family protein [Deltaproteobacteria bacterium]
SGQKMSKSKGNVIDPLIVMDEFGTDAFRFTLAAFAAQGRDIKMSEERIAGYRNFVNKIWNAARFTLMNLGGEEPGELPVEPTLEDRWILSRVSRVADEVGRAIEEYRFNEAASTAYQFVWHEFCDWYLELAKGPLYDESDRKRQKATKAVLAEVFSRLLRILHPFMPFVTEELFQRLPGAEGSIMAAPWPGGREDQIDPQAEHDMNLIMEVIGAVRNIRGEMGISPGKVVPVVLSASSAQILEVLKSQAARIQSLAKTEELVWAEEGEQPPKSAGAALSEVNVFVPLEGLVDFSAEEARLEKELAKLEKDITPSRKKLTNQGFLAKAPEAVVAKEKAKVAEAEDKIARLKESLARVQSFQ